jgi:hypothetical protein
MTGGATTAGTGFAADFLDRCQAANGNRICDSACTDLKTMADDRLGTIGGRMSMTKYLHGTEGYRQRYSGRHSLVYSEKHSSDSRTENESQLHLPIIDRGSSVVKG